MWLFPRGVEPFIPEKQKKPPRLAREKKPDERAYFSGLVVRSCSSPTDFSVEKMPLALAKEVNEQAKWRSSVWKKLLPAARREETRRAGEDLLFNGGESDGDIRQGQWIFNEWRSVSSFSSARSSPSFSATSEVSASFHK